MEPRAVTLVGTLYDFDGSPVSNEAFNLYDDNDHFFCKVNTNSMGGFKTAVHLKKNTKINLVFRRLCYKSVPNELEHSSFIGSAFNFLRGQNETQEAYRSVKVAKDLIDLKKIHLDNKFDKEQVPARYLKDIGLSAIEAKSKLVLEGAHNIFSLPNDAGISELLKGFGVEPVRLNPENAWKILTDGICPLYFRRKVSSEGSILTARFNWDRFEFDKLKSLPNVKVLFIENGKKQPKIKKIKLQFRETLEPSGLRSDKGPVFVYKPHQKTFQEGLRALNSVALIYGQIKYHLTWGHLYPAKVAQMAFDHLPGTVYGEKLILPFSTIVRFISNEAGKKDIFGADGVLNCSGLSVGGISQACYEALGGIDFADFKPREPLNDDHKFAHAQKIYYEMLVRQVEKIVDDNWDVISKDEWPKIHKFFKDLFKSAPYYHPWQEGFEKDGDFVDASEIGGAPHPTAPKRAKYRKSDIDVRSMRPLARDVNGPRKTDKEMLKKFAVFFIHCSTFRHTMAHHAQFEGKRAPHLMDVSFSPITLENYGLDDSYGGMYYSDAAKQLQIASVFKNFPEKHYTLLKSKKVPQEIVEGVSTIAEAMLKYGVDVEKILVSSVI